MDSEYTLYRDIRSSVCCTSNPWGAVRIGKEDSLDTLQVGFCLESFFEGEILRFESPSASSFWGCNELEVELSLSLKSLSNIKNNNFISCKVLYHLNNSPWTSCSTTITWPGLLLVKLLWLRMDFVSISATVTKAWFEGETCPDIFAVAEKYKKFSVFDS